MTARNLHVISVPQIKCLTTAIGDPIFPALKVYFKHCNFTVLKPTITCGSESWTLTMEEERALAMFERKILQKIYGPVKENELWRIR